MIETLGIVLIICGAGGLALVGLLALAPGMSLARQVAGHIVIDEKNLLRSADLTPRPAAVRAARVAGVAPIPLRVPEEVFAELFTLRAEVAALGEELRSLRGQLEGVLLAQEDSAAAETLQAVA